MVKRLSIKMQINTKLAGFTILELIISLMVGAILLGLGLAGFVYFQRSTIFNQARSDYVLVLRDTQNKARNSVSYNSSAPLTSQVFGYAIFITGNNAQVRYCVAGSGTNLNCNGVIGNSLTPQFANQLFINPQASCQRIFFERVTGAMYSLNVAGSEFSKSTPANCSVVLQHSQDSSLIKLFQFNFANGTFTEI